jgi:hypothetical protein
VREIDLSSLSIAVVELYTPSPSYAFRGMDNFAYINNHLNITKVVPANAMK